MSLKKPRATQLEKSRVWVYFTKCEGVDLEQRVRCNLCSLELTLNKVNNAKATLWNHIKSKHSINKNDKNIDELIYDDDTDDYNALSYERKKKIPSNNNNNNNSTHHPNNNNINNNNNNTLITNNNNMTPKINSKAKISNNTSSETNKSKNLSQQDIINDFILVYNDLALIDTQTTSMKPLPSSSLSKNLISRLNQISSPVTRKLKFWNKKSFLVNEYDPSFKVIYLGNLGMQLWSKDESCLEKPLSTLWNNYLVNMKTEIVMRLTICNSGLKAITRQHGLTQYWSNRLVYCCSHKNYPRIFSWIYRHEGKKMRQELRCHAVFCPSPEKASKMATMLNQRLACALQEFKREKKSRGGINVVTTTTTTLSSNNNNNNYNSNHQNGDCTSLQEHKQMPARTIPLRRQILAKGTANFRPPLERSKSAPKLTSIQEEEFDSDEEVDNDESDEGEAKEEEDDDDDDDDDGNGEVQVVKEVFDDTNSIG